MRKYLLTLMVLLIGTFALAQNSNEVYGGLDYRISQLGGFHSTTGWEVSGTHFVTPRVGATAEISGNSAQAKRVKLFLVGPTMKVGKYTFFKRTFDVNSHVLVGAERSSRTENPGTGLAFVVGGSADVPLGKSGKFALRPVNLDYIYSNHQSQSFSSFRYSGGIVIKF